MSAIESKIESDRWSPVGAACRPRPALIRASTALALLACSLLAPALAGPLFSVAGSGPCAAFNKSDSAFAVVGSASDACANGNDSSVSASASGGLGARADMTAYYVNGYVAASAYAWATTTMRFTGPPGTPYPTYVPVSLNLLLTSSHSGDFGGRVGIDAGSFGFGEAIQYADGTGGQRNGGLAIASVDCLVCAITSPVVNFLVDFDHGFFLKSTVFIESLFPPRAPLYSGGMNAMHTNSFPTDRPVFNLPDGYSAFIDGMNVVDNRVVRDEGRRAGTGSRRTDVDRARGGRASGGSARSSGAKARVVRRLTAPARGRPLRRRRCGGWRPPRRDRTCEQGRGTRRHQPALRVAAAHPEPSARPPGAGCRRGSVRGRTTRSRPRASSPRGHSGCAGSCGVALVAACVRPACWLYRRRKRASRQAVSR